MSKTKRLLGLILLAFSVTVFFVPASQAKGNEFDAVCDHLENRYNAQKVSIPFQWLARMAVGIVRPAGVKSFKVTIYKNLEFSPDTLNDEMKMTMRDSFSDEWTPILRIRSVKGEHVYMNLRESGNNIKVLFVTIKREEAVVVRAKFDPDKLVEFMENPEIFGISLAEQQTGS